MTQRLTEARKRILTNTLFNAYLEGWTGDLKDTHRRPNFSSWDRSVSIQTTRFLREEGLVRSLHGQGNWMMYLTRKGIDLAEEIFRDEHDGESSRELAEHVLAERKAEAEQRAREMKEIAHNLRGLTVKDYTGRKALSTAVKEARLEDGFSLKFNREELLDLSRQIEKLR